MTPFSRNNAQLPRKLWTKGTLGTAMYGALRISFSRLRLPLVFSIVLRTHQLPSRGLLTLIFAKRLPPTQ